MNFQEWHIRQLYMNENQGDEFQVLEKNQENEIFTLHITGNHSNQGVEFQKWHMNI